MANNKKNIASQFKAIDVKLLTKASDNDRVKRNLALSSKSRNIWSDIIIRFFRNKWNILFLTIVLMLFIMVYVVKYFLPFSPSTPVSGVDSSNIGSLSPSWIHGWNFGEVVVTKIDFTEHSVPWLNPALGGAASDEKYIISQVVKPNGDLFVNYVKPFAVKTFLGTDSIGRDVFSRLLYGATWSLNLALIVATIQTVIGISVGIYLGYHVGKSADTVFMRFVEFFSSVPTLLWIFVFSLVIGTNFWSLVLVLIVVGWVSPVYSARMFTMKMKDSEFILAAKAGGASELRILYSHILPNVIGRLLVSFVHTIPRVIFIETTLVFLGFSIGGADGNSIGILINEARILDMIVNNITFIISISVFLLLLSISLQIIANGIRDAFDPRLVK